MKIILIVINLCTVFTLESDSFTTLYTPSSNIHAKFCRSYMYYKKIGFQEEPAVEWPYYRTVEVCTKILKSRFFVLNDDYGKYENILNKIKAAIENNTYFVDGQQKQIPIQSVSFCRLTNVVLPVFLCYSDEDIDLYFSSDFTDVQKFFLYSRIRTRSARIESSPVTLLAYNEPKPRIDSRTPHELDMLYFTQRNVFDENNNLIERKPRQLYSNPLRQCAMGYHYINKNVNSSTEIYKVTVSDVYRSRLETIAIIPKRYYTVYTIMCQALEMATNKTEIYYLTPDLEDNSSVFNVKIGESYFSIDGRISSVPKYFLF